MPLLYSIKQQLGPVELVSTSKPVQKLSSPFFVPFPLSLPSFRPALFRLQATYSTVLHFHAVARHRFPQDVVVSMVECCPVSNNQAHHGSTIITLTHWVCIRFKQGLRSIFHLSSTDPPGTTFYLSNTPSALFYTGFFKQTDCLDHAKNNNYDIAPFFPTSTRFKATERLILQFIAIILYISVLQMPA